MGNRNNHVTHLSAMAHQELDLMRALKDQPKTPAELSEQFGFTTNRIRHILGGLYEAGCVRKIRGSHQVELVNQETAS